MSEDIYQRIFQVAERLELPVVILALLSLLVLIVDLGAFAVEILQHLRRRFPRLEAAADEARSMLAAGNASAAGKLLRGHGWTPATSRALGRMGEQALSPDADAKLSKLLADFEFASQRRLGRTRLLVRSGPALGLMGTLIPLSPALAGLAQGDVTALTDNLQLAFSITVLGLLIGMVAFGLTLSRDRLYGQDFSDLEYVAAILTSQPLATKQSATEGPDDKAHMERGRVDQVTEQPSAGRSSHDPGVSSAVTP